MKRCVDGIVAGTPGARAAGSGGGGARYAAAAVVPSTAQRCGLGTYAGGCAGAAAGSGHAR